MSEDGVEFSKPDRDPLALLEGEPFCLEAEPLARLAASRSKAQEFYGDLAYHNWDGHIASVEQFILRLYPELKSEGVEVDLEACLHAAYWHDAWFDKNPTEYDMGSKEKHSAWLAHVYLPTFGVPESVVVRSVNAILATESGISAASNEDMLVTMADLHKVATDPTSFYSDTVRLAYEKVQLGVRLKEDLSEHLLGDYRYLLSFYQQDFRFVRTDGSIYEYDSFFKKSLANIHKIGSVPLELFFRVLGASQRLLPKSWFRIVKPEED